MIETYEVAIRWDGEQYPYVISDKATALDLGDISHTQRVLMAARLRCAADLIESAS